MRYYVITGAIFLSLTGCSSDDTSTGDLTSTINNAELNGNWTRCLQTGATPPGTSQRYDMRLNDGTGTMLVSNLPGPTAKSPRVLFLAPTPSPMY